MALDLFPETIRESYELHEWKHAAAILAKDFPSEWTDLIDVLADFRLRKSYITTPGGSKSHVSRNLERGFLERGWFEDSLTVVTKITVDRSGEEDVISSRTHKIDCYKNRVGIEFEWNSKDQTYVRDLNNFRLLFELNRLSVGVIVTRADHLQTLFQELGRGSSYGASTTHMSKLLPRMSAADGCPVMVFGITHALYDPEG